MDDDFDFAFEAELEAMRELEDECPSSNIEKSRRSLNFSTPSTKQMPKSSQADGRKGSTQSNNSLDDSFPKPLPVDDQNLPAKDSTKDRRKSQKRGQEDLFGDIGDSDEEDGSNKENADTNDPLPDISGPKAKRQKKSPVDDDFDGPSSAEIMRIKRIRKEEVEQNPLYDLLEASQNYKDRLTDNYDFNRQRVYSRIPEGAFVGVTGGEDGTRCYMKLRSEESITKKFENQSTGQTCMRLLGTPLAVLKAQLEEEKHKKVLDEARMISQLVSKTVGENEDEDDDSHIEQREDIDSPAKHENKAPQSGLWVEKYSPARYTDLISDESTNRTLLKWLKLWDYVVFHKEKPVVSKKEKKKEEKKFQKWGLPEVTDELDKHNRPLNKVALLYGPPGLGKTTLGHVIAKHAGYNVVEMNASDDRTAELFKTKIEAATQMKAVIGADPRPNCLIIDEIDGAPLPAINMLISMIKGGEEPESKKKKKKTPLLLRPIICICNDLYVPSLRQLRQLAMVVNFPQTEASKLAGRLHEVTRVEQIKTDLSTLVALCEKADNDIRSCLNTLQFIKNRSRELSLRHVQSLSLGQKDNHKSLFHVWQEIFQMPKLKRKRYVNPYDRSNTVAEMQDLAAAIQQDNQTPTARFNSILQTAIAAGETEKIMQGLHDNYLEAKIKDPRMDAMQVANEWMCFVDHVNVQVLHNQNYSLMWYTSYLPVVFHLLYAANHPNRIRYPHSQFEALTKLNKSTNLITTMLNDMAPCVKKNLNVTVTVTELLPPLLDIISPNLRPVNTQLYSQREKEGLAQLVRVMIAYNMTYHQERTLEGQYNYILDPSVDEVVRYTGMKSVRQMTYAAKQLIAREIELEKMRRAEAALGGAEDVPIAPPSVTSVKRPQGKDQAAQKSEGEKDGEKDQPVIPNHLQTLKAKALGAKAMESGPQLDFFGRKVMKKVTPEARKKEAAKEVIRGDIWFRFKEGYTNAVRKIIRIQDLQ